MPLVFHHSTATEMWSPHHLRNPVNLCIDRSSQSVVRCLDHKLLLAAEVTHRHMHLRIAHHDARDTHRHHDLARSHPKVTQPMLGRKHSNLRSAPTAVLKRHKASNSPHIQFHPTHQTPLGFYVHGCTNSYIC